MAQAKEIILRRVDELGLREASVSTRDEDIIVEVPGEDEASFNTIREIISQTARLEFKLLDDDTDFFGPVAKKAAQGREPARGPRVRARKRAPVGLDENGESSSKTNTYAFMRRSRGGDHQETPSSASRSGSSTLRLPPDRELGFELVLRDATRTR